MLDLDKERAQILDQISAGEEVLAAEAFEIAQDMFLVALDQSQKINYSEGEIRSFLNLSECLNENILFFIQQAYEIFHENKININKDTIDIFFDLINKFKNNKSLPNEWLVNIIDHFKTIDLKNLSKTSRDFCLIQIDEMLEVFNLNEETANLLNIVKGNILDINKSLSNYDMNENIRQIYNPQKAFSDYSIFGKTDFPVKRSPKNNSVANCNEPGSNLYPTKERRKFVITPSNLKPKNAAKKLNSKDDKISTNTNNNNNNNNNNNDNFKDNTISTNKITENNFKNASSNISSNNYPTFDYKDNVNSSRTIPNSLEEINLNEDEKQIDNKENSEYEPMNP